LKIAAAFASAGLPASVWEKLRMPDRSNPRTPDADIDSMFTDRWSPRAFDSSSLSREQIDSLFEAARWSPSCNNEQPWLFVYAAEPADRQRFLSALLPGNQAWCSRVPLLMFLLCRRSFARNDKENRHAPFDAGAAWLALALQARKLGLHAHAMAGFNRETAYAVLGAPADQYDIMVAIAVGRRAEPAVLDEAMAAKERPNERRSRQEMVREGRF
jgi:nitroreductase